MNRVEIDLPANGRAAVIKVAGIEVQNLVNRLQIDSDVNSGTEVVLTMPVADTRFVSESARIRAELEPLGITVHGKACACDCHEAETQ